MISEPYSIKTNPYVTTTISNTWSPTDPSREHPKVKAKRIERMLDPINEEDLQAHLLNLLQDALLDEDKITESSLANLATLIVSSTISEIKQQLMEATDVEQDSVDALKSKMRQKQKEVNMYKVDPRTGEHSEKYKQRSDNIYHIVNDKDVY